MKNKIFGLVLMFACQQPMVDADQALTSDSDALKKSCNETFAGPPTANAFLDVIPQDCYALPSGLSAQLPFKFWGARALLFVGTADLQKAKAQLNPMGYEPLDLFGNGTAAVGFAAIDYENSSAGPIKPIYFFYWTQGSLADPACGDHCAPGMLFTENYFANSQRAYDVGIDVWGIPKQLAMNETSFLADTKVARSIYQGKEVVSLSWNRGAHPELIEGPFQAALWGQSPPEPHFASSNYGVYVGQQLKVPGVSDPMQAGLIAYVAANGDEVRWDNTSQLGKLLKKLDFNPTRDGGFWINYTQYSGVMHDQVFSKAGPVLAQ